MAAEKGLETSLKKYLKDNNFWYVKTVAGNGMNKGIPDVLSCVKGRFIAFELKRPDHKGSATPVQKRNLNSISSSGGIGVLLDSMDFAKAVIDYAENGNLSKTLKENHFNQVDPYDRKTEQMIVCHFD